MQFVMRHPVFLVFILLVAGVSYAVFDRLSSQGAGPAGGPGGFGPGGPGRGGATAVTLGTVSRQLLADRVESVGTAVANESVNLTAKVSDTVNKVHFNDGSLVTQGQVLVELTNDAEATRLAEAQASADDAQRQYDRVRNLLAANLIAPTEVDVARTRVETAVARLDGVMVAMDERLIRAPFTGILGYRNISEGSLLSPNTVITTLDDISVIKLDYSVAEVYLADIKVGQTIKAHSIVYEGEEFEGVVRVVGSRVDPVTRSVSVRAHIDNPDGRLRPGMLLTVVMDLNAREVNVIPEQAVISAQGRQYVFVVDNENIPQRVEVTLGRRRPGLVEVVSGVNPGQRVVVQGIGQVRPGQPVRVITPDEPSLARPGGGLPATKTGSERS
ncbi:MAG: efflux RND transporter periplasmic adaptor subunit [Pseudomonadales bacterium]|nr:efflux RND transporter periplasmic adaptor subunit [Pseudomonadales bacterium]